MAGLSQPNRRQRSEGVQVLTQIIRRASPFMQTAEPAPDLAAVDWTQVVEVTREEGVTPLLYASLKKLGPGDSAPAEALQNLRAAYVLTDVANFKAFRELDGLLELFERENIPVILLKGCALAATLYAEPALRPMSDLDLLIPQTEESHARWLMIEQGYTPLVEMTEDFPGQFGNEQMYTRKEGRHVGVELHWHILGIPHFRDRLPIEWFWNHTIETQLNGRPARILSAEAQFLHLCSHLALHHPEGRLIWSYDLALLLARDAERMNWGEVIEVAKRADIVLALKRVIGEVGEQWGVAIPSDAAAHIEALQPGLGERSGLAVLAARRGGAEVVWDGLAGGEARTSPGYWKRAFFPSREYMERRYAGAKSWQLPGLYAWRIVAGQFRLARSVIRAMSK